MNEAAGSHQELERAVVQSSLATLRFICCGFKRVGKVCRSVGRVYKALMYLHINNKINITALWIFTYMGGSLERNL